MEIITDKDGTRYHVKRRVTETSIVDLQKAKKKYDASVVLRFLIKNVQTFVFVDKIFDATIL